jgi:hypothetical protein
LARARAQWQAPYRERNIKEKGGKGEHVIYLNAKQEIETLALCYGVTQKPPTSEQLSPRCDRDLGVAKEKKDDTARRSTRSQ